MTFLSTPSARRATCWLRRPPLAFHNFYPRPPRGGRRQNLRPHSAHCQISIHALREEGDSQQMAGREYTARFLSTPSARRATLLRAKDLIADQIFLSTPSARRATALPSMPLQSTSRFLSTPSARRATPGNRFVPGHADDFYPRPPRGGRPFWEWFRSLY